MARLVIAYDGSDAARAAVAAVARLLPDHDVTVLVAHEAPPAHIAMSGVALAEIERDAAARATTLAEEGTALAAQAGLAATTAIVPATGSTWPEILAYAQEHGADVLVCGSQGHGALARAVLGSTTSSLLHHAHCSVMVVPVSEATPAGPPLIAFDGSEAARTAIATAAELLGGRDAVVAHAWRSLLRESLTGRAFLAAPIREIKGIAQDFEELDESAARDVLEEGRALAQELGLAARAELVVAEHREWRALAAAADELDAALVVTGSRGLGGIASAVLGSVSSALAAHATRPTLVVRPKTS